MNEPLDTTKPTKLFWIINILALLWNLLGMMAFFVTMVKISSEKMLDELPVGQRVLYGNTPSWNWVAYGVAVFAGVGGCIGLLLRKKWATPVLIISLVGVLVQNSYVFLISNTMEVMGVAQTVVGPVLIIGIGIALIFWSLTCTKKGWIA